MNGPRYNEFILAPKVRVIDENGENLGVLLTEEAMEQAAAVGLDLVEVSPNADPPVAKFLDVGKYKYEAQKKANAARKSQKTQEIKEIKMQRVALMGLGLMILQGNTLVVVGVYVMPFSDMSRIDTVLDACNLPICTVQ